MSHFEIVDERIGYRNPTEIILDEGRVVTDREARLDRIKGYLGQIDEALGDPDPAQIQRSGGQVVTLSAVSPELVDIPA